LAPPLSMLTSSASNGTLPTLGPDVRLHVTVEAPIKQAGPSGIPGVGEFYMVYPVHSRTTLSTFRSSEFTTRRRFKDVVALSELLQMLHPGYFIPPRPHRNAIKGRRMQPRFIEERRAGIERFLNRLAAHAVLGRSEAFQVFLEQEGDLRSSPAWQRLHPPTKGLARSTVKFLKQMVGQEATVPSPIDVTKPAQVGVDLYRVMHERVAAMQGAVKMAPVTPLEQQLREEAAKIEEMRRLLTFMTGKADEWVKHSNEQSTIFAELGKVTQGLAVYEEAAGYHTGRLEASLGEGLLKVSKLSSITMEHTAKHLAHLHDYLSYIPSVQAALHHRENALLTSVTLEVDLSKRRVRIDAGGQSVARRAQTYIEITQLEASLAAARSEYSKVSERNAEELVGFRSNMRADMVAVVKEFALVQVASAQKAQQLWQETLHALNSASA